MDTQAVAHRSFKNFIVITQDKYNATMLDRLQREGHIKILRLEGVDVSSYSTSWNNEEETDLKFLFAQLRGQGFYERHHPNVHKIRRVLKFVRAITRPGRACVKQLLRPTVFEWTTGIPKKEYTIFTMAAPTVGRQKGRCYSLRELLVMRDSLSAVNFVIRKILHPSAIATILRIPPKAFEPPNSFFCTTKELMEGQKNFKSEQLFASRRNDLSNKSSSAEDLVEQVNPSYNTQSIRGNRAHWQYRRRDSSDRSTQPYSAPSSFAVQQSENFQRFYRAVVSPTHVRVTAGGRIVPNTRTPPAFEWNGERFIFEPRYTFPALMSSAEEGQIPDVTTNASPRSEEEGHNGQDGLSTVAAVARSPEPVKISHPSQFDQTKPFLYNGHLVYPVPPGFQPPANAQALPISHLGNPNVLPQGYPAGNLFGLIPAGQHHPQMMLPIGASSHLPMMLPHGAGAPSGPQPLPILPNGHIAGYLGFDHMHQISPYPAPLLPISEASNRHIQNLHALIKTIEDPPTRDELSKQIGEIEAMLATQLQHDWEILEALEAKREGARSIRLHAADSSGTGSTSSQSEPIRKSRLSAAAAMAPPFKPRAHAAVAPATQPITQAEFAQGPAVEETQDEIEARLLSKSSGNWNQSRNYATTLSAGPPSIPKAQSMHAPQSHAQDASCLAAMKRYNTFHGQSESLSSMIEPTISPQAIPYLVGALPQGMQASEAKATDLTYPRPLTEEEVRARYLYWGRAPRSVQKGLPKFDGKDFYPPSPVKEMARMATNSPVKLIAQSIPVLENRTATPDFGMLFTEDPASGIKSPPTPAPEASFQGIFPSPTRVFLDNSNILGYRSPSPRPSTYTYEAVAFPDWSTHFLGPGDPGYKPTPLANRENRDSEVKVNDGELVPAKDAAKKDLRYDVNIRTLNSWGLPGHSSEWRNETITEAVRTDSQSDPSTVEMHSTTQTQEGSPMRPTTFAERIASVSNADQQTQFLQNMLRNAAQTAPALSGTVSATNAQGYLPQYRGSAVASLAPTATNVSAMDRKGDGKAAKEDSTGVLPLKAANFTPENRPINRDRPRRAIRPCPETLGAEGYMRYVTARAEEDKKVIESGWNSNTTGTGPIIGSDW